jgi:outer membrane receptor protein involved in Fe transport
MKQTITAILLLLFVLSCVISADGHTGSVRGLVCDSLTRSGLAGASFTIGKINKNGVTDSAGSFFAKGLKPGTYQIVVRHLGYKDGQLEVRVEDGVTTDVKLALLQVSATIDSVAVSAKKYITVTGVSWPAQQLRPVDNTQDLMRLVPGLFIAQHQGGGKAEQIFLRGFDCDHGTDVNVSVDNMPVNMVSHAHGQGFADAHFIIPESVQNLDYGKGTYKADKGNFCTAGYVAFKTRTALDDNFVRMDAGMYGYYRTVAGINLANHLKDTNGKTDAYIMGEYAYNRGYFDLPQNLKRVNLIGKYTRYISSGKILSLSLSGFTTGWDASGQIPERAVNTGLTGRYSALDPEGGKTGRANLNLNYYSTINDHSYFKTNIYLTYYQFLLFSNFTYFLNDPVNGDQIKQAEQRGMGGYNNEYTTKYKLGRLKMKTQIGQGLRRDDVFNDELSHTANFSRLINRVEYGDVHETNIFGYADQTVFLSERWTLTAALRYDYFLQQYSNKLPVDAAVSQSNSGKFSPKAGLSYDLNENLRLYYNYGTGFHTNDSRTIALGRQYGSSVIVNNTIPQAFSHDLGAILRPFKKLKIAAALWRLDLQQEYTYSGDAAIIDTSGRTRRYGVDFTGHYDLLKWIYLEVDVNYAHGRAIDQPAGNDFIALAPPLTSIGSVTFRATSSLFVSLRYRHLGDRPANDDNSITAPGYTLLDAVANYTRPKYEFGVQVQNLLNTHWNEAQFATETRIRNAARQLESQPVTDICYTPGIPLAIKLSATYTF